MARILVVDDTAQNLSLIELYLRGTEFEVVTASGGNEALDLCMQEAFALILLDVVMPGIDGFEVCRRLKNDPRTAFVPVIFLTARLGDESDKVAAYQLGAVDYIQKPVNREELVARIRVMLRLEDARSRLDRENAALRQHVEDAQSAMQATAQRLEDLEKLRQEFAIGSGSGALLVDRELRVLAADAAAVATIGAIAVGEPLVGQGWTAGRVTRLIEDGARSADLTLVNEGDATKIVQVTVCELGAEGRRLVLLRDVTGIRQAERRLQDRELVDIPALGPAARKTGGDYSMTEFVGSSARIRELSDMVGRLRHSRSTVLIYGESGTGKELVARALHFDGKNRGAPFIPLHCGAIAPELVESELFGHEKGAFTGAQQAHDGLFRAADGGTIFLDEIAEMSLSVQVKLLRVLQRGEIRPVGANQSRIVNVRILAATNRDLQQMVREGRFREDLYYRLEVVMLHLVPLRERIEDLPMLADHFVRICNRRHDRLHRPVRGISEGAMAHLLAYPWPGNVRELENAVERAFALGVGDILQVEDLSEWVVRGKSGLNPDSAATRKLIPALDREAEVAGPQPGGERLPDLRSLRQTAERDAILRVLRECRGDKIAAAHQLGLSRSTFYRRLKELDL
jgi:two-component system, NtrC family, response regulator HydG